MAAKTYREKRRTRKHASRLTGTRSTPRSPIESARLIPLGTVASLVPEGILCPGSPELSLRVADRYEIQVGPGFQPHVLARLVRTLEQLA